MSNKLLLIKLPEPREIHIMAPVFEVETDSEGNVVFLEGGTTPKAKLDDAGKPIPVIENGIPKQVVQSVEYASPLRGLAAAVSQNTAELLKRGYDFFDIQDTRKLLNDAFDRRNRSQLDDRYLVVNESQSKLLIEAVRIHDWLVKVKIGEVEQTMTLWMDWFEFFDAIRQPAPHDAVKPDTGYASWFLAKTERVNAEKAEEEQALQDAAGGSSENENGGDK